jgi:hypothetical protein
MSSAKFPENPICKISELQNFQKMSSAKFRKPHLQNFRLGRKCHLQIFQIPNRESPSAKSGSRFFYCHLQNCVSLRAILSELTFVSPTKTLLDSFYRLFLLMLFIIKPVCTLPTKIAITTHPPTANN